MKNDDNNNETLNTPSPLQQMEYLGRIERVANVGETETQTWKCTFNNCQKTYTELYTNNWRGLTAHVARHAQIMNKNAGFDKGKNFLCPYCNGKHKDMKAALRHLVEQNCNENRCNKYEGKKLWKDFTEANW